MSKIHLIDNKKRSEWEFPGNDFGWLWVVCGIEVLKRDATEDEGKATCKNCLREMRKKEKGND